MCVAAMLGFLAAAANAQDRQPRFYGLVVGISNYEGSLALKAKLDDGARQMKVALERYATRAGYKDVRVSLLVDRRSDGTREDIEPGRVYKELRDRALEAAGERDTLVFYFTGHGSRNSGKMYLYASGAKEGDDSYYIEIDRLFERLQYSKAVTKIVFIDACQVLSDPSLAVYPSMYGASEMETVRPQGTAIFYASSRGRPAYIDTTVGFGYFTKELVDIMSRDDNDSLASHALRSAGDLDSYLKRAVRIKVADREKQVQEPHASVDGAANYDLMPLIPNRTDSRLVQDPKEVTSQVQLGLRAARDTRAGEPIASELIAPWPKNVPIPRTREQPSIFERDLRGACFAKSLSRDSVITWMDIELCTH
jgi:hypothetical protein